MRLSSVLTLAECNCRVYSLSSARRLRTMGPRIIPRRQLLQAFASLAVCAPAVVRAPSLMGISARFCGSYRATPPWTAPQEALALLQHEMERRFAETLFGAENISAEAENPVLTGRPLSQKRRLPSCGSCERCSGLEVRPPSRSKICQPKSGRVFLRCLGAAQMQALGRGRRGSPARQCAQAFSALFDNPSRSWNMASARSLDYARG